MSNKKTMQTVLALSSVLLCGFIAVLPFFGGGFIPTHDGEYHIIRFMEFDRMIRAGYFFPRWAPTINSGYGLPLFEFMYPFPNYVATLLHFLGLEFVTTFKVSSALSYLVALVFCFLWLKSRFSQRSAVVGTIAAAFVPYWFVELYVRGSIGELWAITFLFAALWSIEKRSGIVLSFTVAAIILCHNVLAMLFIPIVSIYTLYRANWRWLGWVVLGIGCASWFWVPALMESKFMVGLNTVGITDHFASVAELLIPSWGTGFSGSGSFGTAMSLQIGVAVLLWIFYATLVRFKSMAVLFIGTIGVIFMMLPWSTKIWKVVPFLSYLQFPWRLLVWFLPVTAWVAAAVTYKAKNVWIPILLTVISIVSSFSYTRGAVYAPRNDEYYLAKQNFIDGTSSLGNSLSTIWTPWKEKRAHSIITDTSNISIPVIVQKEKYVDRLYEVNVDASRVLRLHILYFPGWTVLVDGNSVSIDYVTNGTIDVFVPAGTHTIEAIMVKTPVRRISDWISMTSLVITLGLGILLYRNRKKHEYSN